MFLAVDLSSEACSLKYCREMVGVIDEKHSVADVVFPAKIDSNPYART